MIEVGDIEAARAGNHAQGVAYHGVRNGLAVTIVMPESTPLIKVSSTRSHGAEVLLHGASYDEACEEALRRCADERRTFIHPFDDPAVIAGQGTIGLELLEQNPYLEAVVVPIGGGGLVSGIACAMKETNPRIKVYGVETARLPSMKRAVESGRPVSLPAAKTIGDGIAVRRAGEITLPLVAKYVDEIVTVDEEEIANAILLLLEREKTVAEGAGAAPLAALVQGKLPQIAGKEVAVLVSGGNIDVTLLARIIERGLVKDGRLVRLLVHVGDVPGALHGLTGIIAEQRANVIEIQHDRASSMVNLGDTAIELTLETRGPEHVEALCAALAAKGYELRRLS